MPTRFWTVDAFTSTAFRGNPAAVVPLETWPDEAWLRAVAAEFRHAETAFLVPPPADVPVADEPVDAVLRWFTPSTEVDLCGHATLAAAVALWDRDELAGPERRTLRFRTRSGVLTVRPDGGGGAVDLPTRPAGPVLDERLAVAAATALRLPAPPVAVGTTDPAAGRPFLLVAVADAAAVRSARPDLAAVAALDGAGVVLTAPGDDAATDVVSRFFAPSIGVDEDPVTGAAHGTLAPFWAPRLRRDVLRCAQVSRRGGRLRVTLRGPRTEVAGDAVVVTEGVLRA